MTLEKDLEFYIMYIKDPEDYNPQATRKKL